MIEQLLKLSRFDDWAAVRAEFGEMINLAGPAPSDVVRRALEDQRYATSLLLRSQVPSIQRQLLRGVNKGWTKSNLKPQYERHSNMKLIGKGVASLARWGISGFKKLDDDVMERRWAACQACPHLLPVPQRIIYKGLRIVTGEETRICGKRGCNAKRKTTFATEKFPAASPDDLSKSHWGDVA